MKYSVLLLRCFITTHLTKPPIKYNLTISKNRSFLLSELKRLLEEYVILMFI